jgi:hypothetical protein
MISRYSRIGVLLMAFATLAGCGGGGGGGDGGSNQMALKGFGTTATTVISITGIGVNSLVGNPFVDANGRVYLPDSGWYKLFAMNSLPNTATTLNWDLSYTYYYDQSNNATPLMPAAVLVSGSQTLVLDMFASKILIWNSSEFNSKTDANLTLPRPLVEVGGGSSCSGSGFSPQARGMAVVEGNLVVADTGNDRVLIYKGVPSNSSDQPVYVLGQSSIGSGAVFDTCQTNNGTAVSGSGLNTPTDVSYDGTHLIVADSGNNRLLMWRWSEIATGLSAATAGQPSSTVFAATKVIGQPTLATNTVNHPAAQVKLNNPQSLAYVYSSSLGVARLAISNVSPPSSSKVIVLDGRADCQVTPCEAVFPAAGTTLKDNGGVDISLDVSGLTFVTVNQLIAAVSTGGTGRYIIYNATATVP